MSQTSGPDWRLTATATAAAARVAERWDVGPADLAWDLDRALMALRCEDAEIATVIAARADCGAILGAVAARARGGDEQAEAALWWICHAVLVNPQHPAARAALAELSRRVAPEMIADAGAPAGAPQPQSARDLPTTSRRPRAPISPQRSLTCAALLGAAAGDLSSLALARCAWSAAPALQLRVRLDDYITAPAGDLAEDVARCAAEGACVWLLGERSPVQVTPGATPLRSFLHREGLARENRDADHTVHARDDA